MQYDQLEIDYYTSNSYSTRLQFTPTQADPFVFQTQNIMPGQRHLLQRKFAIFQNIRGNEVERFVIFHCGFGIKSDVLGFLYI